MKSLARRGLLFGFYGVKIKSKGSKRAWRTGNKTIGRRIGTNHVAPENVEFAASAAAARCPDCAAQLRIILANLGLRVAPKCTIKVVLTLAGSEDVEGNVVVFMSIASEVTFENVESTARCVHVGASVVVVVVVVPTTVLFAVRHDFCFCSISITTLASNVVVVVVPLLVHIPSGEAPGSKRCRGYDWQGRLKQMIAADAARILRRRRLVASGVCYDIRIIAKSITSTTIKGTSRREFLMKMSLVAVLRPVVLFQVTVVVAASVLLLLLMMLLLLLMMVMLLFGLVEKLCRLMDLKCGLLLLRSTNQGGKGVLWALLPKDVTLPGVIVVVVVVVVVVVAILVVIDNCVATPKWGRCLKILARVRIVVFEVTEYGASGASAAGATALSRGLKIRPVLIGATAEVVVVVVAVVVVTACLEGWPCGRRRGGSSSSRGREAKSHRSTSVATKVTTRIPKLMLIRGAEGSRGRGDGGKGRGVVVILWAAAECCMTVRLVRPRRRIEVVSSAAATAMVYDATGVMISAAAVRSTATATTTALRIILTSFILGRQAAAKGGRVLDLPTGSEKVGAESRGRDSTAFVSIGQVKHSVGILGQLVAKLDGRS